MSYKRSEGRLLNELREVSVVFDGLDGVDGSARFGFGETKALSSVSGPMEVRLAVEHASKATFEVLVRPLAGLPGTESKALASTLRCALLPSIVLTNNPRTLIQLVVQALTPVYATNERRTASLLRMSPALVAATINASSLALLNTASFPLCGVVCAAAVGRVRGVRVLLTDPKEDELGALDGSGTFAFLVADTQADRDSAESRVDLVLSTWSAAPFDEDELMRATELARVAALRVWKHMKEAVARAVHGPQEIKRSSLKIEKSGLAEPLDDDTMEIS